LVPGDGIVAESPVLATLPGTVLVTFEQTE